jgi:peroxiredoxin
MREKAMLRSGRSRSIHVSRILTLSAGLLGVLGVTHAEAQAQDAAKSFSSILTQNTRKTFQEVAGYVRENPNAGDAEQAYRWLFQVATTFGMETDAIPLAEMYLKRDGDQLSSKSLAFQVRSLGLIKAGKSKEALADFDEHLQSARLRSANATIDYGISLATAAQLAGDYAAARTIYEKLPRPFFLNRQVRKICENRLAKLDLADAAAPEVTVQDFDGKQVTLAAYKGKVVLVDFWATNCPPCLKEFPAMKQLYAKYHKQGLEVIGISLDADRQLVDGFQEQWKLPWAMTLSGSDRDATRTRYKARTIPSLFLVDRDGKIAYVDVRGQALKAAVEKLMSKE